MKPMINFVGQEKMSPAQLALETARYEFSKLHGSTISREGNDYKYVFDSIELNKRIDAGLEYLATLSSPKT